MAFGFIAFIGIIYLSKASTILLDRDELITKSRSFVPDAA